VRFHHELESRRVSVHPDIMVVGGGIAGMQAALDIGASGHQAYLVEKSTTIGGHMLQFDKTFPTLDCAACIGTPKMVEVAQNPNIHLLSYSEVKGGLRLHRQLHRQDRAQAPLHQGGRLHRLRRMHQGLSGIDAQRMGRGPRRAQGHLPRLSPGRAHHLLHRQKGPSPLCGGLSGPRQRPGLRPAHQDWANTRKPCN
jgi:hypothetical protein